MHTARDELTLHGRQATRSVAPGWLIASALAFVAGWTDTVGFIALLGLFTAHVTGNFVIIGAAIVSSANGSVDLPGLTMKLAALPLFALGVAAMALVVRARQRAGRSATQLTVVVEALLLLASLVGGCMAASSADPGPWIALAGATAVLAMGVQNAAGRLVFTQFSPTTVMTVNVAQVSIDLVDMLCDKNGSTLGREARARAARLAPPLLAFTAGAIVAAVAYRFLGYLCLAVPVLVLFALSRRLPASS